MIIEGNAEWSLPLVQVHSDGYLTDDVRADLALLGAQFPRKLQPLAPALYKLALRRWKGSRGPRIVAALFNRFRAGKP